MGCKPVLELVGSLTSSCAGEIFDLRKFFNLFSPNHPGFKMGSGKEF